MDRALDSGQRVMEEYETDRSADEPKDSPRSRIAQNLKRQIDTVSERWSMLCQRSEEWQKWIDEVLRVSVKRMFLFLPPLGRCVITKRRVETILYVVYAVVFDIFVNLFRLRNTMSVCLYSYYGQQRWHIIP